jgi:ACR3 family arsenite transporter
MAAQFSRLLQLAAIHGRWILAISLFVGLLSQTLADIVKPHIEILIALLLFTTCLRVGPKQALGAMREIRMNLIFTIVLQVLLPITIALFYWLADIHDPLWLALILLTAAPAISGSPHLVALLGFDPTSTLRQLIIGTALLPVTIIPVFALMPEIGSLTDIVMASVRLSLVILGAAGVAFAIRYSLMTHPGEKELQKIDGVSTILLAIMVLGLMAAIHSEISDNPLNLLKTLLVAISANFGLQIITTLVLARSRISEYAVPMGLIAGNRNIALFMTALAITTTQPLLLFIACYQIPMYLTPIIMSRFYQHWGHAK